jgi:hypothetical protein
MVGPRAFIQCRKLVTFPDKSLLEEIGEFAFAEAMLCVIQLVDSIRKIGSSAVANCPLSEVGIREKSQLMELGAKAFFRTQLQSTLLPPFVRVVGESCFDSCGQLDQVSLGKTLEFISRGAFRRCPIHSFHIS